MSDIVTGPYVKPIAKICDGSVIIFAVAENFKAFKDEIIEEAKTLRGVKDSRKYLLVLVTHSSAKTFFIDPKKGERIYQSIKIRTILRGDDGIDIKIFQIHERNHFIIVKGDKDPYTKEWLSYSYVIGIDHEERGFSIIPTEEGKDIISEVEEFRNGITKRFLFGDVEQEMLRCYESRR